MKTICSLAVLTGLTIAVVPAAGMPLQSGARELSLSGASLGALHPVSDRHRVRRRQPVQEMAPRNSEPNSGDAGGYVVNQYGFGNYVAGPAGFGGFPAGSANAQIWKQRQEWKCQNVPETC